MVAYELDLNVIPGRVLPRLNVSQYDHGQTISFVLWELNTPFELPSGAAVSIAGTKPDGTGFIYSCELQNNQPVATITEQMSAVAGEVTCELVIVVDGDRQGTINFIIDVEPAALCADVPISETDIPVIEQIPEMVVEATEQAQIAEAWATGGEGGEASATNNAKYWAEQSQSYAVGALHWKGNTTFANIPTTGITTGDVYNVTDAFTTDSRFNEGTGIECEAGTNIIYGNNGKWDIQAPPSVHSFNGRKGAVVPASGDYTDALVTSSAITGKATVKAALQGLNTDKQSKTMSQAIAGQTTVEGCLSQLNTDLSDKQNKTWRHLKRVVGGDATSFAAGYSEYLFVIGTPFYNQVATIPDGVSVPNFVMQYSNNQRMKVGLYCYQQHVVDIDYAEQDGVDNTANAYVDVFGR